MQRTHLLLLKKIHTCRYFFFNFIEFWGRLWLITINRCQVYNSIIPHLYIIECVHHPKSSLFVSIHPPFTLFCIHTTPFSSGNHHTIYLSLQETKPSQNKKPANQPTKQTNTSHTHTLNLNSVRKDSWEEDYIRTLNNKDWYNSP